MCMHTLGICTHTHPFVFLTTVDAETSSVPATGQELPLTWGFMPFDAMYDLMPEMNGGSETGS